MNSGNRSGFANFSRHVPVKMKFPVLKAKAQKFMFDRAIISNRGI